MDSTHLFCRTYDDLSERISSQDPYVILGASALIRKLFIDDDPLVDQVNRSHKIKLSFVIGEIDTPYHREVMKDKPRYWSLQDGLDPKTKLVAGGTTTLKRDKFFDTVVLIANGKEFNIRELIKFEANVMGGIHAGKAKTDQEKALASLAGLYMGNTRASLRQLLAISRVILSALSPLRQAACQP
jgi:hypothetical protein